MRTGSPSEKWLALLVAHGHFLDAGKDLSAQQRQPVRRVVEERVAAPLRFERQRERRVAGDVDRRNMVHLDGDLQRHCGLVLLGWRWSADMTRRRHRCQAAAMMSTADRMVLERDDEETANDDATAPIA